MNLGKLLNTSLCTCLRYSDNLTQLCKIEKQLGKYWDELEAKSILLKDCNNERDELERERQLYVKRLEVIDEDLKKVCITMGPWPLWNAKDDKILMAGIVNCTIPYIRKYWRSLNLTICTRSGCNKILAKIKFGGCTARTKHSK